MTVVEMTTFTHRNIAMPMPQTIHPTSLPFVLANASNTKDAKINMVPLLTKNIALELKTKKLFSHTTLLQIF